MSDLEQLKKLAEERDLAWDAFNALAPLRMDLPATRQPNPWEFTGNPEHDLAAAKFQAAARAYTVAVHRIAKTDGFGTACDLIRSGDPRPTKQFKL